MRRRAVGHGHCSDVQRRDGSRRLRDYNDDDGADLGEGGQISGHVVPRRPSSSEAAAAAAAGSPVHLTVDRTRDARRPAASLTVGKTRLFRRRNRVGIIRLWRMQRDPATLASCCCC